MVLIVSIECAKRVQAGDSQLYANQRLITLPVHDRPPAGSPRPAQFTMAPPRSGRAISRKKGWSRRWWSEDSLGLLLLRRRERAGEATKRRSDEGAAKAEQLGERRAARVVRETGDRGPPGIRSSPLPHRTTRPRHVSGAVTPHSPRDSRLMGLFSRKPKISRPTPVFHAAAPVRYPNTMIEIRPSGANLPGGGNYTQTVYRHLMEIESTGVGAALFQELGVIGKTQTIIYAGPNSNQAAGSAAGYKRLRKYHDAMDNAQFSQELQYTLQQSTHDRAWLARELYNTSIPTWQSTTLPSPFRSSARVGAPAPLPPGARKPLPATPIDLTLAKIDTWLAGTARPTIDEMDVLMLVLAPWARSGNGVGTRINYDPHKDTAGGLPRPPHAALFHELVHAYYNAKGDQLGREDSSVETAGGRLFELMSVGLPPFDNAPYSENAFRAEWPGGCAPRAQYP